MATGDSRGESSNVTVWVKLGMRRYVEPLKSILWRVRYVARMGETHKGFPDGDGTLVDLGWDEALSRFPPTIMELLGPHCPLPALIRWMRTLPKDTLHSFFSRLQLLCVCGNDFGVSELQELLTAIPLLHGFSYSDLSLDSQDFEALMKALAPLQLRAIDISGGDVDFLLRNLNVELIRFCGSPGVKGADLASSSTESVTVQFVAVQELNFCDEQDAERFLSDFERRFPRVNTLLWDWNIVDPEVTFDERSTAIADTLVRIFRNLNLQTLAIVAYTPSTETYAASERLARHLSTAGLPRCSLRRFATKGLPSGQTNFVLFTAGANMDVVSRLEMVICDGQNASPDLRHLLHVWDPTLDTHASNSTFEFYGFDSDAVRKEFDVKFASKD